MRARDSNHTASGGGPLMMIATSSQVSQLLDRLTTHAAGRDGRGDDDASAVVSNEDRSICRSVNGVQWPTGTVAWRDDDGRRTARTLTVKI